MIERFQGRETFLRHPVCDSRRGETSGMHVGKRDGRENGEGDAMGRMVQEGGMGSARARQKWS